MGETVEYKRKNEIALLAREDINPVGDEIGMLAKEISILEKQKKDTAEVILTAFNEYDIDKWITPNGTQITRVIGQDKEVEEFDFKTFAEENPALAEKYMKRVTKYGKAPYIKITPPKD